MLTEEEKKKALVYASNDADFKFIPYENLINLFTNCDPRTKGIPNFLKYMIMSRIAIRLDKDMIIKYCLNKLDKKNSFILDNGDIQVIEKVIQINTKKDLENEK